MSKYLKSIKNASFIHYTSGNTTTVIVQHQGKQYLGKAWCHVDDSDFLSEKVGITIAHYRAQIRLLVSERNKLSKEVSIIEHFFSNYDPNDINDRIRKDFINLYSRLEEVKQELKNTRNALYHYLKDTEIFIEKTKAYRKDKNN